MRGSNRRSMRWNLHPHFQQPARAKFCPGQHFVPIGYSPIGHAKLAGRDKTDTDTVDVEDPVVVAIAKPPGRPSGARLP